MREREKKIGQKGREEKRSSWNGGTERGDKSTVDTSTDCEEKKNVWMDGLQLLNLRRACCGERMSRGLRFLRQVFAGDRSRENLAVRSRLLAF